MKEFDTVKEFDDIFEQIATMKEHQSHGAPFDIKAFYRLEELVKTPHWEPFYGYNTQHIPNFEIMAGGGVSFKQHLGKPLTEFLWEDLMMRIQVCQLCIFRANDAIPCIGTSQGGVYIHLDEKENVRDIYYTPYCGGTGRK